jgi:hypothetical protein
LAVDPTVAGRLWAAAAELYKSDDAGDNWVRVGDFVSVATVDASSGRIAVFGKRPGDTYNKLYYSPDNGANWTERTKPGYRFPWLRNVSVDPTVPGKLWIAGISAWVSN